MAAAVHVVRERTSRYAARAKYLRRLRGVDQAMNEQRCSATWLDTTSRCALPAGHTGEHSLDNDKQKLAVAVEALQAIRRVYSPRSIAAQVADEALAKLDGARQ